MGEWSNYEMKLMYETGHDQYRLGPKNQVYKRRTKYPEQFIPAGREITRCLHELIRDGEIAIGKPETMSCWDTSARREYTQRALKLVAVQASAVYPPGGEPMIMSAKGFTQYTRHVGSVEDPNRVARIEPAWDYAAEAAAEAAAGGASLGERPSHRAARSTSARRGRDDRSRG